MKHRNLHWENGDFMMIPVVIYADFIVILLVTQWDLMGFTL